MLFPIVIHQPTTDEINQYVENNSDTIVCEFENFYDVDVRDVDFETDKLEEYTENENELGICFPSLNYIIISNEEKYIGYSAKEKKRRILNSIEESNKFVKGVMIHEICHIYVDQVIDSLRIKRHNTFESNFIEEGICEYSVTKMGELILSDKIFIPLTTNELFDTINEYNVKYKYSSYFVKNIIDKYGLTKGIIILFKNSQPTINEILKPEIYYRRLNYDL